MPLKASKCAWNSRDPAVDKMDCNVLSRLWLNGYALDNSV
ncbi:hypothetical protein JCM19239_4609 [Vibrio variabilis]|uniref:Uncharacterized protein n=1 Tax=Vibrio variabilis TaxID=990271 RepID=A0ABQ0J7Z0_9VIBR|nr:hypothetical protein JCM19239_4609 [Vibrio variabilis]